MYSPRKGPGISSGCGTGWRNVPAVALEEWTGEREEDTGTWAATTRAEARGGEGGGEGVRG